MFKKNKLFIIFLSLSLLGLLIILIPFIILSLDKSNDNSNKNNKRKEKETNKTLSFLFIDRYPFKLRYQEGETFDPTGLILRAYYDDESNPEIINYKSEYNTPINLYDRFINFLYEDHTCGIELDIINDENILIRENYSFEEYILEFEKNCITRFEIEEADITEWKISNNDNDNKDKIIP